MDTTLLEHDCMTMLGLKESALGTLLYMAADE